MDPYFFELEFLISRQIIPYSCRHKLCCATSTSYWLRPDGSEVQVGGHAVTHIW